MKKYVAVFVCLAAAACVAPDQRFEVGSALWLLANPEFEGSHVPNQSLFKIWVGVLDGGFDYNAPMLRNHLSVFATPGSSGRPYGVGYDVLGEDYFPHYRILDPQTSEDVSEDLMVNDHGTHVAQLVSLNDRRIGLLPVRMLPLASLPSDTEDLADPSKPGKDPVYLSRLGHRSIEVIAKGMEFAIEHGASVLNLSLGCDLSSLNPEDQASVLRLAHERITQRFAHEWKNTLLIVAAGNESRVLDSPEQSLPATLDAPDFISVGALAVPTAADRHAIAYYSNHGRYVDLYTRGSDLKSSVPGQGPQGAQGTPDRHGVMQKLSGTSMAAPVVAHAAAQVRIIAPWLSATEVRALLLNTADSELVPFEGHAEYPRPEARKIRILNVKAARTAASLCSEDKALCSAYTQPVFAHGQAPIELAR